MAGQLIAHFMRVTRFEVAGINAQKRMAYFEMLAMLARIYERMDHDLFNQFDDIKEALITDDIASIETFCGDKFLGCAAWGRGISAYYWDRWNLESIVPSMELAHWAFLDFGDHRESNDVIHYAANVHAEPYIVNGVCRIWGYSLAEKIKNTFKRRPLLEIPLMIYNMPFLVREKDRIMREIRDGTAPKGSNPYWSTGLKSSPTVMLPTKLLDFLSHYGHSH